MAQVDNLAYIDPEGVYGRSVSVVDSFTAPDGTVYEARASALGNGVVKITTNEDGTKTTEELLFHKTRGIEKNKPTDTRIRNNIYKVNQEFEGFKQAAEAAASSTETIGYTDSDVISGGGGFLKRDKASYINLTDASGNNIATISSTQGKTSEEIRRVKALADELININKSALTDDDDDKKLRRVKIQALLLLAVLVVLV